MVAEKLGTTYRAKDASLLVVNNGHLGRPSMCNLTLSLTLKLPFPIAELCFEIASSFHLSRFIRTFVRVCEQWPVSPLYF